MQLKSFSCSTGTESKIFKPFLTHVFFASSFFNPILYSYSFVIKSVVIVWQQIISSLPWNCQVVYKKAESQWVSELWKVISEWWGTKKKVRKVKLLDRSDQSLIVSMKGFLQNYSSFRTRFTSIWVFRSRRLPE